MAKAMTDTEYLFLSAKIRAMENRLLSRERVERMLASATAEEAAKVLRECGYPEMSQVDAQALEQALWEQRRRLFDEVGDAVPDQNIVDVFKAKYDYHNVKVILKGEARGIDPTPLLIDTGRVPPAKLLESIRASELRGLPAIMQRAIEEAQEVLGAAGDPQQADIVLDKAYFADLFRLARDSGSDFLTGYVRLLADSANLRAAVRALRMGKGTEFLRGVLIPGGNIAPRRVLSAAAGGDLAEAYAASPLNKAAAAGKAALEGGGLLRFEKLCDEAALSYVSGGKYVAFGAAPVIGYLAAKENELAAVRILLSGRMAGLEQDSIRERLREGYV